MKKIEKNLIKKKFIQDASSKLYLSLDKLYLQ